MWLIICWLVGLPKILYHFFLTISILIWYLCYKIFGTTSPPAFVQHQQHQEYQQNFPLQDEHRHHFSGHLRDKVKLVLMKGTMAFREKQQDQSRIDQTGNQVNQSCIGSNSRSKNNNNNTVSQSYLSSLATVLIVVLICFSKCPMQTYCREQDADILEPIAGLAKSAIKTVTLGEPFEIPFELSSLVKNLASLTWRTRFFMSMPQGFPQKAQDFYDRVKLRVNQSVVEDVDRKTLAALKVDMDKIVDSIVEHVRQTPEGSYTTYLETRVDGVLLEDACTALGVQLKAYGVDLSNYRNIAAKVLGIPVMPTVASTIVNLASVINLDTVKDLTHSLTDSSPLRPTTGFITNLPTNAINSVSQVSSTALDSVGSLSEQLSMQNIVKAMPVTPNFWRQLQAQQVPGGAPVNAAPIAAY